MEAGELEEQGEDIEAFHILAGMTMIRYQYVSILSVKNMFRCGTDEQNLTEGPNGATSASRLRTEEKGR